MWKFASYDFSGNFMSSNGKWTTKAARKIMLNGIGAGVGATDSVLCTAPFRLVGLGFEAPIPGCISGRSLSVLLKTKVGDSPANAEGLSRIEEPCNQLIRW